MKEYNSRRHFIKTAAIAGLSLELTKATGAGLLFAPGMQKGKRVGIIGGIL